jgi:solute:Na+ symporter, SSS family
MIAASVILMTLVLADMGGPIGLYHQLTEQFGSQVVQWHPPTDHEMLGIIGVIAWTVGTAIGYGGDVAPMAGAMEGQRLLSCRNSREATKMYIWTEIVLFFLLAILTLPALGAMVKWPGLYTGQINKELAYGMLLAEYLPPGILGIALIAMAASIMSTVDSNLNFGAQVILNDIYRRFIARTASLKHYLTVGRIVMFIIMGLAILVATRFENVIDISVFMLGLSSAELTANWAQWWWWRFNGKARLAASIGGPLIFVTNKMLVFPYLTTHAMEFGIPEGFLSDYSMVLSSIALTTLLWIVTALVTHPDPEEKLIAFYRLARPLGWWGPIAEKVGEEPAGSAPIFRGMGIAITGTIMVAAGTIAFCSLYVARWHVAALAGITCAIAGILFKATYGRFLRFLERHAPHDEAGSAP